MKKYFSYGEALRRRSKHDLIVPDFDKSFCGNIADLVRLTLKQPVKKYILLPENTAQANVFRIAQHYGYDLNDAKKFYELKQEEYMDKHYNFLGSYVPEKVTVYGKQFAMNELYDMLKKTTVEGVLEGKK